MERVRSGRSVVVDPGRANEGRQGSQGSALSWGDRNHRGDARGAQQRLCVPRHQAGSGVDSQKFRARVGPARGHFRNWAGNRTDTPREICELALAHTLGNSVERSYWNEHAEEKHRELLEKWDRYAAAMARTSSRLTA